MGRKPIIIVIGIILILLALAEPGSARPVYGGDCSFCHDGFPTPLTAEGLFFRDIHKFNGIAVPTSAASCATCHVNPPSTDLTLTMTGANYSGNHRYDATTLAAARLAPPACNNCHIDVVGGNFAFLSGTPTYLKATTCENCHKLKFDNWTATMHRVMLTENITADAMGLPTPPGFDWQTMTFVIVGKPELRYLNDTGYLFKRYFAENGTFADYGPSQYTCGRCHTTGYNASGGNQSGLPGIVGTWSEPGIACERCHGPGGNGHQVEANVSEQVCLQCHNGSTRQGTWLQSKHSPPLEAPTACLRCHSPFDYAENRTVTSTTAINVVCANCHNSHNTSDDQYKVLFSPSGFDNATYADVKDAKNSLFNATATRALRTAGDTVKDIYDILTTPSLITDGVDESYPGQISVTGPISEVLCSNCHYNHGLSHIGEVNLTHGRKFGPLEGIDNATCIDCHMATSLKSHTFNAKDQTNFPSRTCSRGTECHVTSAQNLNESNFSVVPVANEWRASAHNNSAWGEDHNRSFCAECHSPINWNPLNASERIDPENYKGVTCAICHNLHDMGDWLTKTELLFGIAKPYAWYNRDAFNRTTHYRANYTIEETTTGLCANCHRNRPDTSVPSLTGGRGPHGIVVPHNSPQKDLYIGSVKESMSPFMFECATCHMYIKKIDPTNLTEKVLPDNQKVTGHTFLVNETGLQSDGSWNNLACSVCHVDGSALGTVEQKIDSVQTEIQTRWDAVNVTVENSWTAYDAFVGEKALSGQLLAESFFKLYLVKNDGSWGVHNPQMAMDLLNDSEDLANEAVASLGQIAGTFMISGYKINDANGNGSWDEGEMGLENWNIRLICPGCGGEIANTTTNDTGFYEFLNVNNGSYVVTEDVQAGWMNTSPASVPVIIDGQDMMNVNFTNKIKPPEPAITDFNPPVATVMNNVSEARTFDITVNQTVDVTWYINGSMVSSDSGVTVSSYTNSSAVLGEWNVSAVASNENGTVMQMWNWVVTMIPSAGAPHITSFDPPSPVGNNVSEPRTFSITVNQTVDVIWYINGSMVSSDSGVTASSYTNSSAALGTWNVSAVASNDNGTDMQSWDWIVTTPPPPPSITNTISGYKVNDMNNNGISDAGEAGLSGWQIKLFGTDIQNLRVRRETTTDAQGFYIFSNLPAGNYLVLEVLEGTWVPTSGAFKRVTLEEGGNVMNNNFTNRQILFKIPSFPSIVWPR